MPAPTPRPRLPVTVIGGYLGAGKTTLLNHLLRDATERIAVLVNDFGEINIDLDLIERRTDDTIELSNGCICCSMLDGFSEALDRIVAFDPPADRLVIETSGVSDPATVAAYGHGPGLTLDAVIVLVDAETIRTAAGDRFIGQTIGQQLRAAEILLLNKADLVEADQLAATRAWLDDVTDAAIVLTTTQSRVAPEVLFGAAPATDRQDRPAASTAVAGGPHSAGHNDDDQSPDHDGHDHPSPEHDHHSADREGHDHETHRHDEVFSTTMVEEAEPVDRSWVDDLMASLGDDVVRAKGLVQLADEPATPYVLQRVGRRWSLRPSAAPWPDAQATRIVVITVER